MTNSTLAKWTAWLLLPLGLTSFLAVSLAAQELQPHATALAAGSRSGPYWSTELLFPLHPQHNHAPGLAELPGGELLASWYRGSGERQASATTAVKAGGPPPPYSAMAIFNPPCCAAAMARWSP